MAPLFSRQTPRLSGFSPAPASPCLVRAHCCPLQVANVSGFFLSFKGFLNENITKYINYVFSLIIHFAYTKGGIKKKKNSEELDKYVHYVASLFSVLFLFFNFSLEIFSYIYLKIFLIFTYLFIDSIAYCVV